MYSTQNNPYGSPYSGKDGFPFPSCPEANNSFLRASLSQSKDEPTDLQSRVQKEKKVAIDYALSHLREGYSTNRPFSEPMDRELRNISLTKQIEEIQGKIAFLEKSQIGNYRTSTAETLVILEMQLGVLENKLENPASSALSSSSAGTSSLANSAAAQKKEPVLLPAKWDSSKILSQHRGANRK